MLDFSEWTPMPPKDGPPLPAKWRVVWPSKEEMTLVRLKEGPPLPIGLKIKWPWIKE